MSTNPDNDRKPHGQNVGDIGINPIDGDLTMGIGNGLAIDLATGGLDINVGGISIPLD